MWIGDADGRQEWACGDLGQEMSAQIAVVRRACVRVHIGPCQRLSSAIAYVYSSLFTRLTAP